MCEEAWGGGRTVALRERHSWSTRFMPEPASAEMRKANDAAQQPPPNPKPHSQINIIIFKSGAAFSNSRPRSSLGEAAIQRQNSEAS